MSETENNQNRPQKSVAPKKVRKHWSFARKMFVLFLFIIVAWCALPLMLVLGVGLLPTLTVLLTDSKNTNKIIIVGSFNFAGVIPVALKILDNFAVNTALSTLQDVFNLVIMFGMAGLGIIFYYEIPKIFESFANVTRQQRLNRLDEAITRIKDEWGDKSDLF